MGEVRACVYFSVIFLCFQISVAKPFFGTSLWCDFLCDDDDGSTTTASSEDYFDMWCDDCPTRIPRPTTTMMPPAAINPAMQPPMSFLIPSAMNVSLIPRPNGGWWDFSFTPWSGVGGPAIPAPPPGATPAPAPAATTVAGTTVAGAATTAAPTTVAAGK